MSDYQSIRTVALLALLISVPSGLLLHSAESPWKPLHQARLGAYVGAVEGDCCKPGNRKGCAAGNFNCFVCPAGSVCTGTLDMPCTDATCQDADPEDVCDYSPQTVGLNTCTYTGSTSAGCGTQVYPSGFYCGPTYFGPGEYQLHKCIATLTTAWNAAGHATATRSVCDGASTCTVTYALCEG